MLIFALNKNENDMKTFIHADDLGDLRKALAEAADIKEIGRASCRERV